jgi:hypothetical protein
MQLAPWHVRPAAWIDLVFDDLDRVDLSPRRAVLA